MGTHSGALGSAWKTSAHRAAGQASHGASPHAVVALLASLVPTASVAGVLADQTRMAADPVAAARLVVLGPHALVDSGERSTREPRG